MNILDTIRDGRPAVDPMPVARQRAIRESLFGVRDDHTPRTTGARSESGAVVSTAPHGMRIPVQRRPPWHSWLKIVAGLFVVAFLGIVGWAMLPDDEQVATDDRTAPSSEPVGDTVAATAVPEPPTRTGVTRSLPLLLPRTLLRIDAATIGSLGPGTSAVMLEGPDGTNVWIAEFDGEPDTGRLDYRQVGSVLVAATGERDGPTSYRVAVPCGLIVVNDAPGRERFDPAIEALFASLTLDADAALDSVLPAGWSVVSVGDSELAYTARFQVPAFAGTVPVDMVQIPGGTLAQLAFGGAQLEPITFLGGPAFINIAPVSSGLVSIFWRDDDTVFNVSSSQVSAEGLEEFVASLEPATVADWSERFSVPVPEAQTLTPACAPQPSFGPAFNP